MKRISIFALLVLILTTLSGCSEVPEKQAAHSTAKLEGDGLVVLCYHRILPSWLIKWGNLVDLGGSEFSFYSISTKNFASQLDFLQEQGVRFLTPQEAEDFLTGKKPLSGKLALVTFDDGDLSLYKHAFPVLKEKQIPFLLFFIPHQAGEEWEGHTMCSWSQIEEMTDSGVCTIGLHTYDLHYYDPQAKQPVFLLPENTALFEEDTKKGLACLEKQLGIKVKDFAYPYGFGTPQTDEILIAQGIHNIFTLRAKVNQAGSKRSFIGRVMGTPESWYKVENWARSP